VSDVLFVKSAAEITGYSLYLVYENFLFASKTGENKHGKNPLYLFHKFFVFFFQKK
jgi:hypothetical protein